MHTVIQVVPQKKFNIYVYFSDGRIKLYDLSHLIGKGVFAKLSDQSVFEKSCTVLNGTLAFDLDGTFDETKCIDIDPETIYQNGIDIEKDPLEKSVA